MSISLYDISVRTSLQTLDGVSGFLAKARAHCEARGIDLAEIAASRLIEDMHGFGFQIVSVAHHSLGSIRGVLAGEFRPPEPPYDLTYDQAQERLREARDALAALDPATVNARLGERVVFHLGSKQIPFTAENFVLSFSHPNLFFHATTAYDLLRMRGVPIGKRDFTGPLRIER